MVTIEAVKELIVNKFDMGKAFKNLLNAEKLKNLGVNIISNYITQGILPEKLLEK